MSTCGYHLQGFRKVMCPAHGLVLTEPPDLARKRAQADAQPLRQFRPVSFEMPQEVGQVLPFHFMEGEHSLEDELV